MGGVPERIVFRSDGHNEFFVESGDCYALESQTPPGWTPSGWGVVRHNLKTFEGREKLGQALVLASSPALALLQEGQTPEQQRYARDQLAGHLRRASDVERAAATMHVRLPGKFNKAVSALRAALSTEGVQRGTSVWDRLN